jgi:hypothetical protein
VTLIVACGNCTPSVSLSHVGDEIDEGGVGSFRDCPGGRIIVITIELPVDVLHLDSDGIAISIERTRSPCAELFGNVTEKTAISENYVVGRCLIGSGHALYASSGSGPVMLEELEDRLALTGRVLAIVWNSTVDE